MVVVIAVLLAVMAVRLVMTTALGVGVGGAQVVCNAEGTLEIIFHSTFLTNTNQNAAFRKPRALDAAARAS